MNEEKLSALTRLRNLIIKQPTEPKEETPMEFDPLADASPEDLAWIEQTKKAKARQEAVRAGEAVRPMSAKEHDEAREAAAIAQAQVAAAQNGIRPSDLLKGQPAGSPAAQAAYAQAIEPGAVSLWVTIKNDTPEIYSPDWKNLKARLKRLDGTHLIRHYQFKATAENVLGFCRPGADGCEFPISAPVEEFNVLVQGGLVFRSDPE